MKRYNPQEIEPKWQKKWADDGLYKTDMSATATKHYIIPMLPYPSGDLHIGHWYNFAPTDTVARYRRMQGHNVLTTIGFDAFGLPAENAAIKRGIQPAIWTHQNIETMTKQINQIGASYDWDHSLATCDPTYYRWNQWLFLQLYKHGLAYKAKSIVNWCPKDQTVLANEQVVGDDNVCDRCGTAVIQKEMEQWFFKITDFADRLLDDLDNVEWPKKVKTMQANWIGKSTGALITFPVENSEEKIEVFTTRPDTIFGVTYMVVAPEHKILDLLSISEDVKNYIEQTTHKTELERKEGEKDKTGVFIGAYAINPATNEKIPIWVADYVLMGYGTGAIMAVPAHDERDGEFAKKFELPIKDVIEKPQDFEDFYTGEGVLLNSGEFDGTNSAEARDKITEKFGKVQTNYRLRDWLISRQRYWGTPIPIIYCDGCGIVPVPEEDLPVILPEDVEFELSGQSPLGNRPDFVNTKCSKCGVDAKRETDTMDTFVCSSWYFLRYLDNKNDKEAFTLDVINKWAPLDHYIGGVEHAILHLLYARFITKFLHDKYGLGFEEPFKKLTNQGIILGPDGQKMSKSRGNVVSPDEQVNSYGTDSLRLYLMFMGPYELGGPYSMGGITGTRRFLERVWALVQEQTGRESEKLQKITNQTVKKVSNDLESLSFNTAISAMMEMVNEIYRLKTDGNESKTALETLVKLLAPFAPHIADEMWSDLGNSGSIHAQDWPTWDENLIKEEKITIAVQINGKVRAELEVSSDISEEDAINLAKSNEKVSSQIEGKEIKKAIYVPGRLVSLVVSEN
jgi:leucyl-tRNA synthetase